MDELEIGYEALRGQNRGLVYASITPFGQTGPWRDYKANDIVGIALGNLLYWRVNPANRRCNRRVKSLMAWRLLTARSASPPHSIIVSKAATAKYRCVYA